MRVQTPAQQLLFSTVRIEFDIADGISTGTGFLFAYRVQDGDALFLVTNKHVVEGCSTGRLVFTLADGEQPKLGSHYRLEISDFGSAWHGHPSPNIDVAVTPFAPISGHFAAQGMRPFVKAITQALIPSPGTLARTYSPAAG
jgi:hypothetical protein